MLINGANVYDVSNYKDTYTKQQSWVVDMTWHACALTTRLMYSRTEVFPSGSFEAGKHRAPAGPGEGKGRGTMNDEMGRRVERERGTRARAHAHTHTHTSVPTSLLSLVCRTVGRTLT